MTRILKDVETGEEFEADIAPCKTMAILRKREPEPREFADLDHHLDRNECYLYNEPNGWARKHDRLLVAEALRQADRRYKKL